MDIVASNRYIKVIAFAFCLFVLAGAAVEAKQVPEYSGAYAGSMIWQDEVNMTGDVLVLQGGSLVIRAGTRVNVYPAEGTKIDPEYLSSQTELLIRGRVDIQGTSEAPVSFVIVENDSTEQIAWAGITLDHASESRIRFLELERADIAIRCVSSSPEIVGNTITDCRYGVIAQNESHPRIAGNQLANGEGGIFCWNKSNPEILDNRIVGHDEEALFVDATSRPRLGRNVVSNNAIGLALYPRSLSYQNVETTDNQQDLRWLGQQGQGDVR